MRISKISMIAMLAAAAVGCGGAVERAPEDAPTQPTEDAGQAIPIAPSAPATDAAAPPPSASSTPDAAPSTPVDAGPCTPPLVAADAGAPLGASACGWCSVGDVAQCPRAFGASVAYDCIGSATSVQPPPDGRPNGCAYFLSSVFGDTKQGVWCCP